MYERFTDIAMRAFKQAQEEARALNHDYVGTEHVLLALVQEDEGSAAKALALSGIMHSQIRAKIEETIGEGAQAPTKHVRPTPGANRLVELSYREALQLGHNYVGTGHLLLGVMREGSDVVGQVLRHFEVNLEQMREAVRQALQEQDGPHE